MHRDAAGEAGGTGSVPVMCLRAVGVPIEIRCDDTALAAILRANFAALRDDNALAATDRLRYRWVRAHPSAQGNRIVRRGKPAMPAADAGEGLYLLEKDLTVALQRRRSDLLFLHGAAIARAGRAMILAGDSGAGKSTTAWALVSRGWEYLSDELAPVDLGSLVVAPYPHALCLKRRPPSGPPLPQGTLDLGRTLHVPADRLGALHSPPPRPLEAIVFVGHDAGARAPRIWQIGRAEAAARLYTVALNALAHRGRGLDATLDLAARVPCFRLEAGELGRTADLLVETLGPVIAGRDRRPTRAAMPRGTDPPRRGPSRRVDAADTRGDR